MSGVKAAAKSLAQRLGYEVHRAGASRAELAARTAPEGEYYRWFAAPEPVFSPWEGHPDFEALFDGAESHTIVSRDRCYILASLAGYASRLQGDAAECGVYNGGTALLLCRVLSGSGCCLYLFDSFQGLPEVDPDKDRWFHAGQYAAGDVESVERLLADFDDIIEIRRGWIPETFAGLEDKSYVFAHIDVDLYRSALDCCAYFYPRLVPGGVLLFDEYGFADAQGEREAVDEFFDDKPESPITLPTGQAIVLKLPAAPGEPS
jgi:O-methyltransferase